MIKKNVLIFGSTGQIGRHLIRKLTKNNYKVICQTRNSHKAIFLKTSGSIGYIEIKEANIQINIYNTRNYGKKYNNGRNIK